MAHAGLFPRDNLRTTVDEAERLAALYAQAVLDTAPEQAFDELAELAARICRVPVAAVSLVDETRQWFKARVGIEASETPRDVSFCAYAMWKDDLFVVPDASLDAVFETNALVTGAPHIRFYAGAAIRTPDGVPLGALCVIGPEARPEGLTEEQGLVLRVLANQVEAQLQLRNVVRTQARIAERQATELLFSQDREARLLKALTSADVGWWDWDIDADRVVANAEMARMIEVSAEGAANGASMERFLAKVYDGDRRPLRAAIEDAVEAGEVFREDFRVALADGAMRWVSARGRMVTDEAGLSRSFTGVAMDITAQKRAEARVRDADHGRELAFNAAHLGYWDHKPNLGERFFDARAVELLGVPPAQANDLPLVLAHIHPEDRARMEAARERALDPGRTGPYRETFRMVHPSGEVRWVFAVGRTYFADGVCIRFMGVLEDITEARRADEHRRLLVNELNHRVKNTLALMQSLVDSTLRSTPDPDEARIKIGARIQALGRAHDQLTASSWSAADVGQVVEATVEALSLPRERMDIHGPAARLGPQPALQLSLALHELATNALKYGALSNQTGRVGVEWSLTPVDGECRFELSWTEAGGPSVRTPSRRGFGSQLIERATAAAFGGEVSLDYAAAGVRWRIAAPYEGLAESGRAPTSAG